MAFPSLLRIFFISGLPLAGLMWSTAALAESSADTVQKASDSSISSLTPSDLAEVPTATNVATGISEGRGHQGFQAEAISADDVETVDSAIAEDMAPENITLNSAVDSGDSDGEGREGAIASLTPETLDNASTAQTPGEDDTAANLLGQNAAGDSADTADSGATDSDDSDTTVAQGESVDGAAADGDGVLRFTVTGTRNPVPVDDLPATVTVFERDDWEFYEADGLQELLRYEPGVSVDGSLQRYGAQDINIRGIEGNRVLFQVDNIRLPESFTFGGLPPGGFRIGRGDYVDFATLQAIEVLRGPASTLYGSDALGGVVSYRSLQPSDLLEDEEDTFAGDISSTYLSASGGFNNVGRFAGRIGPATGVFVVSRRDARELDNFGPVEFSNSIDTDDTNVFTNLVYEINDSSQLNVIFEEINRSTKYKVAQGNRAFSARRASLTQLRSTGENRIERTRLSLGYEYDDADSESFLQFARAQIYYQNADTTEEVSEIRPQGSARLSEEPVRRDSFNEFESDSFGADLQLRSDFETGAAQHRLTYGIDFSQTENSRPRDRTQTGLISGITTRNFGVSGTFPEKDFADGETTRLGIYVQDEISIGDFEIIAGLRFDHYDLDTSNSDEFNGEAVDLDASALSPRIALLYRATPELSLYGQYARGFRAPLYSEITSGFTNFAFGYETISSPDLEPETSDSFEIGIRGNYPQFDFGITGFYNTYDNFIATGQLVGRRQIGPDRSINQFQTINVDGARIYGIEVSGEYRFSPEPYGFSILGSLSYTVGDDEENDEPLNTIDPLKAVLGLRYTSPDDIWRAEFIGTFAGEARTPDGDQFVPDGYAVFDLIGSYNPTPNFGVNVGIYNIFNNEYYQYSEVRNIGVQDGDDGVEQYTQPGINVRVGLNVRF